MVQRLLAICLASALLLGALHAQKVESRWHKSLKAARADAQKSGRPILLEFR